MEHSDSTNQVDSIEQSDNPHRLPRTVTPSAYSVRLRPDIAAASFEGSVEIAVDIAESTNTIVLNAIELELHQAVLQRADGDDQPRTPEIQLDSDTERLTLTFDEVLAPGPATLFMSFTGILNDKLRGFYRSTFSDDDGNEHTIATTQFESTNARRAFPCWDEPDFKAVFAVTLEVPDDLLAVSAMAEVSRTPVADGLVAVEFAPTPLMSTYLLAFVVGALEASPAIDVDGVPVRIIHRPGHGDEISFAHDAAVFCLRWLTEYFGVPYFGDKIDLLAIPDFAFGAMENTGCVTFREVLLLVDPDATTQPEQQRSVAVIAHELAHMWFGNLVTMKWWEGLWLKEAFATFMETSATHAYRPDWKVWEGFALDRSAAYDVDALHSTRPIEYVVESPADAEGMYDVLTYEKGAAVVRMLEQFVGPDKFRDGIRDYMREHAFSNTVTSDLWNAVGAATGLPVDEIMDEWINVGGFPLVDTTLEEDGEVSLEQSEFKLLADGSESAPAQAIEWKIPVTVTHGSDETSVLLVPNGRIPLETPESDLVIVDPESHGFFRARYGPELSRRLAANLMQLTSVQRYSLFDDLFDLVLAGRAEVSEYVALARSLHKETSPPVWTAVTSGISTLAHIAPDRATRAAVGEVWDELAGPQLELLGLDRSPDDADALTNEVRASLMSSLGSLSRDEAIIAHARSIVSGDLETDNASVESAAVRIVASTGDRADYDEFLDRFRNADSPQIERRYLFSLARFDDGDIIDDLCARAVDGTVRSQDAAYLLGMALSNRWHGGRVWQFITSNWDQIEGLVPDNAMGRMLGGVQWLEHEDTAGVRAFLDEHPIPQARLAIAQHLEKLEIHAALRERVGDRLAAELSAG